MWVTEMARTAPHVVLVSLCLLVFSAASLANESPGNMLISTNQSMAMRVSAEDLVFRRKRSFPLELSGPAEETGYYNLSGNPSFFGLIFGHLVLRDSGGRTLDGYKCEGLLIGPKHVLTVFPECVPNNCSSNSTSDSPCRKGLAPDNVVVYQYTKIMPTRSQRVEVNVQSMWRTATFNYLVALLADDQILLEMDEDKFPVLSWTKQNDPCNYDLFLERAVDYPVLLSTPTATQDLTNGTFNLELKRLLIDCFYERDPHRISLRNDQYNPNAVVETKPLNGASFFKPSSGTVALFGLISDKMVKQCEGRAVAKLVGRKRSRGHVGDIFFCADRMGWEDVLDIYQIGLAVDNRMPRDNGNVFPRFPTEMASWNMQSLANMDETRALSTKIYDSVLNILKRTQILALQEVSGFEARYKGKSNPRNSLQLLQTQTNIGYRASGEFAFIYDETRVQLASIQSPQCGILEEKRVKHKYAYWCKFQFVGMRECFTMYTAHFRYSGRDAAARALEFEHFSNHSRVVQRSGAETCSRIQILAGDFNLQSAKETMKVASNFIDFRFLDAGPTTVAKAVSHYDRILVSETLRIPHHYIFPGLKTGRGPTVSEELFLPYKQTFLPRDNPLLPTLRQYEPVVRSYQLSDHLPVQIRWEGLLNIGTWNMENHKPATSSVLVNAYTKVLSLFSVLAVQELLAAPTPNMYNKSWTFSPVLRRERLGFAYNSNDVTLTRCSVLTFPVDYRQRPAYACIFREVKTEKVLAIVNLHLLNQPRPSIKYVNKVINYIRNITVNHNGSTPEARQEWKNAYIMGDFNLYRLKSKWNKAFYNGVKCNHTKSLPGDPAAPWTFTRVLSKLTLDYIYTPELADKDMKENNVPGSPTCRVINPELEEANGEYLLPDSVPKTIYSFISSWKELSDHYPVFMKFVPPTEPPGNNDAKRKFLGVSKEWP